MRLSGPSQQVKTRSEGYLGPGGGGIVGKELDAVLLRPRGLNNGALFSEL